MAVISVQRPGLYFAFDSALSLPSTMGRKNSGEPAPSNKAPAKRGRGSGRGRGRGRGAAAGGSARSSHNQYALEGNERPDSAIDVVEEREEEDSGNESGTFRNINAEMELMGNPYCLDERQRVIIEVPVAMWVSK